MPQVQGLGAVLGHLNGDIVCVNTAIGDLVSKETVCCVGGKVKH